MLTRIVIIMLIAVLALPITTLTRRAEPSPSPWGEIAVEAKGKKHKKTKQPKSTTVTRTERQLVTQTFSNTEPITIPDGAPTTSDGKANPYPSAITVSGFSHGVITDINLILDDFSHTAFTDVDLLLSTNDARHALVLSDVIEGDAVVDVDLTLDDEAAAEMPQLGQDDDLTSGTYRPTNHTYLADTFAAPAPTLDGTVALSTFDGADPNGTWQLWVMDNASGDYGDLGGWALQITAETDVQIEERAPDEGQAKAKKHKQKGKQRR